MKDSLKTALYALIGPDLDAARRKLTDVRTMPTSLEKYDLLAALGQMGRELRAD